MKTALLLAFLPCACAVAACSSPAPDTSSADAGDPHAGPHTLPPAAPTTAKSGGVTRWFAVSKVRLGINDEHGKPDPKAWQSIGYDLDGRITTLDDSTVNRDTCRRADGSPHGILVDGNGGIDNNFGGHFMQTLKSLKSDVEDAANASVVDGVETLLIRLDNVTDGDNAHVPGAIYVARKHPTKPAWNETDRWPVVSTSLLDGKSLEQPKAAFPDGYVRDGVWVSGALRAAPFEIGVNLTGVRFTIAVERSLLSFRVADGNAGVIAGVVSAETLNAGLTPGLTQFGVCPGNSTYEQVMRTLDQSVDLVLDAPSSQDPSKACDAMSIGIGFSATPTGVPSDVIAPEPVSVDTTDCPPKP